MMYDETVKRLKNCATQAAPCLTCGMTDDGSCIETLMKQAADAIEFLQTYKTCFDNIVSMGGWWLVGNDKNLYRMDVPMNWPPRGTKTVELFPLPEPPKEKKIS